MRRSWFIWAIVVGVASIVLAAVIMRVTADDDGNPSATAWADSVCTSLATWRTSIQALTDVSGGTLTAETLQQKIEAGKTATQTLVDDLKSLGPPDLESGDEAKQLLTSDLDEIQSTFDSLQQAASDATSSGTLSLPALAPLVPKLQALLAATSKTVQDLQDANVAPEAKAELQSALADAESCQQLQSDG